MNDSDYYYLVAMICLMHDAPKYLRTTIGLIAVTMQIIFSIPKVT